MYTNGIYVVYMHLETIPSRLTSKQVRELELLVTKGYYANKSEAIRDAVRVLTDMKLKQDEEKIRKMVLEDIHWGLSSD